MSKKVLKAVANFDCLNAAFLQTQLQEEIQDENLKNYCNIVTSVLCQARAWFPEFVFRKVCVCMLVCLYV